jgi:hypothetical protein
LTSPPVYGRIRWYSRVGLHQRRLPRRPHPRSHHAQLHARTPVRTGLGGVGVGREVGVGVGFSALRPTGPVLAGALARAAPSDSTAPSDPALPSDPGSSLGTDLALELGGGRHGGCRRRRLFVLGSGVVRTRGVGGGGRGSSGDDNPAAAGPVALMTKIRAVAMAAATSGRGRSACGAGPRVPVRRRQARSGPGVPGRPRRPAAGRPPDPGGRCRCRRPAAARCRRAADPGPCLPGPPGPATRPGRRRGWRRGQGRLGSASPAGRARSGPGRSRASRRWAAGSGGAPPQAAAP